MAPSRESVQKGVRKPGSGVRAQKKAARSMEYKFRKSLNFPKDDQPAPNNNVSQPTPLVDVNKVSTVNILVKLVWYSIKQKTPIDVRHIPSMSVPIAMLSGVNGILEQLNTNTAITQPLSIIYHLTISDQAKVTFNYTDKAGIRQAIEHSEDDDEMVWISEPEAMLFRGELHSKDRAPCTCGCNSVRHDIEILVHMPAEEAIYAYAVHPLNLVNQEEKQNEEAIAKLVECYKHVGEGPWVVDTLRVRRGTFEAVKKLTRDLGIDLKMTFEEDVPE